MSRQTIREWPIFDATFDDVYQDPEYAALLGESRPVSQLDVQIALSLAFILKQQIRLPARFLVDHQPLIETLKVPDWEDLVLPDLLQPASKERDWHQFLARCGGSPDEPPLVMTSYGGAGNDAVRIAWNEGRGYLESRELFTQQFPAAADLVEKLASRRVRARPLADSATPYRDYLSIRLKAAGAVPAVIEECNDILARGAAIRRVTLLATTPAEREAFIRAAISAKHDELRESLLAATQAKPAGGLHIRHKRDLRHPSHEREVPALGAVINGMTGVEHLRALQRDGEFRQRREDFAAARALGTDRDFDAALAKLATRVAEVLSLHSVEARAITVAVSLGSSALVAAVTFPEHSQVLIGTGSGLMLLAAAMARVEEVRSRLYYNRPIAQDIIRAGRGQF